MVRFDFVFDADLNVYLMEVNMSPNLSTGHFSGNKHIYQSVLYSLFNLVGVARPTRPEFTQGWGGISTLRHHSWGSFAARWTSRTCAFATEISRSQGRSAVRTAARTIACFRSAADVIDLLV